MTLPDPGNYASAVEDFHRARSQAFLKEIFARLKGETTQLLSYEEVRQALKAQESAERGLQDIPLDAIVGSVGRYTDFSRDFLPLQDAAQDRWARVKLAVSDLSGLPPIDVYQIREAYFVRDGNHRVSVARQLGATHIQAYVTEVRTRVPFTPDVHPDELITKAEYAQFLEYTHLDELRPDADLGVTIPGQYPILEEHIDVHRYFLGINQQREIPYEEATASWYDTVYYPLLKEIRERGILRNFPKRTETDLYCWIAEHRAAMEEELGWEIKPEFAIRDLLKQAQENSASLFSRVGERLLELFPIPLLEGGAKTGQWRQEASRAIQADALVLDILIPINGKDDGWAAMEQAVAIARREHARLHGLHVVHTEVDVREDNILAIKEEFDRRCSQYGVEGSLVVATGDVADQICDRSRWTDLVVVTLAHPPGPLPVDRLESGFRDLIQRCPRPVLAVPEAVSQINRAMLAYDGSPKSDEALYIATYLASKWDLPLWVITVFDKERIAPEIILKAQMYLENHQIKASFITHTGPAANAILVEAELNQIDLIIMGGYGSNPLLEVVLGSIVDQVLREAYKPVLICR